MIYSVKISWLKNIVLALILFLTGMQKAFAQTTVIVSIPFKPDSYVIEAKCKAKLDTLIAQCHANSKFNIRMFGFTDTIGREGYNDTLSQKRVDAVFNYLSEKISLNNKNCYYSWQGEDEEKYDLHFNEAHVRQRFVDIKVHFGAKK